MATVIRALPLAVSGSPGAKKKEERQDAWIEKLVRGLTAIARNVPQARDALYQLLVELAR